jgi:hypothetical protein
MPLKLAKQLTKTEKMMKISGLLATVMPALKQMRTAGKIMIAKGISKLKYLLPNRSGPKKYCPPVHPISSSQ